MCFVYTVSNNSGIYIWYFRTVFIIKTQIFIVIIMNTFSLWYFSLTFIIMKFSFYLFLVLNGILKFIFIIKWYFKIVLSL
jgi:hypothetical protein